MNAVRCATALFVVALATASSFGQSQPLPNRFIATYFAADGRVVLEKGYDHLLGIVGLRATGPGLPFSPNSPQLDQDGEWLSSNSGFADSSLPNEVSWLFLQDLEPPLEFVAVFPPKLFIDDLLLHYSFRYFDSTSHSASVSDPVPADWRYVPVPEPSALFLALLAAVGVAAKSRVSRVLIAATAGRGAS